MLNDLILRSDYNKEHDVIKDFYVPCLEACKTYDRISGYFSSAIFDLASSGFVKFFGRMGSYRLVCSPYLSAEDAKALESSSETRVLPDSGLLLHLLEDPQKRSSAQILCHLINAGRLEVKLAISSTLMHEKVGVFSDGTNRVSFDGSINETARGWGLKGNQEYFNCFVSWNDRDAARVSRHAARFEEYWSDSIQGVDVRAPDAKFIEIVKEQANEGEDLFNRKLDEATSPFVYQPETYQQEVLESWKCRSRKGIVQFCTGAGKTVVGMLAMRWAFSQNLPVLVLVPSKTLLSQWSDEVKKVFPKARLLLVGGGNTKWKEKQVLEAYFSAKDSTPTVVVASLGTARQDLFLKRASKNCDVLFVADEVHNYGAQRASSVLALPFRYRLGLSATPERFGDTHGTKKIFDYFGRVLEPSVDIPRAIAERRLVPYIYDFEVATLTAEEQDSWDELTKSIGRLMARGDPPSANSRRGKEPSRLEMLVLKRSRIAKKASQKIALGIEVLRNNYRAGQRWLVFLEDSEEVEAFQIALHGEGLRSMVYEGSLSNSERVLVRQHLDLAGGIVLSMRCLDEGVDIPSVSHALIMASSQNPRQFIQRRGRVLRFAGDTKKRAYVWDIMAMPQIGSEDTTRALVLAEFARAIEFSSFSENGRGVQARLNRLLAARSFSPDEIYRGEVEQAEEAESEAQMGK
ncbi:DEAD/DEAH box helicase family protein [Pseudomonadales bacterium]|nr:DEAD/DEAH box helicase family protein [Pseudomonadales bacterium]